MIFRQNRLLTVIMVLGVLAAAWALALRHSVEMRNHAVEITVDYAEVAQLAGASGLPLEETLRRLKDVGVASVAIQQRTLGDLVAQQMLRVARRWYSGGASTRIEPYSAEAAKAVHDIVSRAGIEASSREDGSVLVQEEPEYLLNLPDGMPEAAAAAAKRANMGIVARLVNYPRVSPEGVEATAQGLKNAGIDTVIFAGDQILGFRGSMVEVAEVFKRHGIAYGSVEFARQKGDQSFSERMLPDVIRVHSISAAEMGTLDRASAVERFVRAVKERNIRIAYVRMFDLSASETLETNLDYISSIADGLRANRFELRKAHSFGTPQAPLAARLMMALGISAGVVLLVLSVVTLAPRLKWTIFFAFAVVLIGMVGTGAGIGLKVAALAAAVTFPILAVLQVSSGAPSAPSHRPLWSFVGPAAVRYAAVVAVSFAGGLIVAGLLSEIEFMLRVDQFAGVKLAQLVPILTIAAVYAAGVGWGPDDWSRQKSRALESLRRLGSQPVLIWQSALALVLFVMVALLLARSGNEPGVGVSQIELRLRAILDTLLFVRPRTKEFLFGHPAMLIGIAGMQAGRRNWAPVLITIGVIGEVSLVNTFCHIHTQVAVSALRSAIGAALGLVLGAVLLLIFFRSNKSGKRGAGA